MPEAVPASELKARFSSIRAWYVVFVLMLAYVLAFVDRQVITLLVEPIKSDLGINDTQVSLLMGFAFSLFYVTMGVPIARLSDRTNRRNIICAGIVFWSIATAACGLAKNFFQLFLGRVAVGVGEAALTPAAYSIIADTFPRETQGRAIAVYSLGVFLGSGLAMVLGGTLIGMIETLPDIVPSAMQSFASWQLVFIVVGLPGILLALLIFLTVSEPERKGILADKSGAGVSIRELFAFLWLNRRAYFPIFAGYSAGGIGFWAYLFWAPEFLRRTHGLDVGSAGIVFGLIITVCGSLGVLLGGWFNDKLTEAGYRDAPVRLAATIFTLAMPVMLLTPLVTDRDIAIGLLSLAMFIVSMQQALSPVALQAITPNEMRAQIISLFILVASFSSIAFGASSVALMTDYVFKGDENINQSLAAVSGVTMSIAAVLVMLAVKPFRASAERAASLWSEQ